MARYKPQDRNSLLLPVVLSEQIVPGSFAFALDWLVDNELELGALDARLRNDEVGASAYDPRVMLKIVLPAYSQSPVSSRAIEQACSFPPRPGHARVRNLDEKPEPRFRINGFETLVVELR